ncbi:MAG: cytochrome P450, partial [Actinomycetota bacterium]
MTTARPGRDELDPLAPETFDSAHETFADLRTRCPVAHSEAFGGFWALLRHRDVVDVLTRPKTFVTSVQNVVPKVAFTGRRPPLHLDPPEHTPYRQVINRFFTGDRIAAMEPAVHRIAADLLDPLIAAGGGDLCIEFTHRYPGHVLAEFFNLPADLGLRIREITAVYNRALQEARDELVASTSRELYAVAQQIIDMRRDDPLPPEQDLVNALLAKRWRGEPLPDDMVLGTIRQMIVVGMIAPSVHIGTMVVHLSRHPDLQERLRTDPSLLPAAVEEYLRLYTPYRGFARTAVHDVEIRG